MPDTNALSDRVALDAQALRQALGAFATGVTIVTARDGEGRPVGLTANSFNSVSLDPPLVLWSLSLGSANIDVFRNATGWAVHILASGQRDLSNRFASRGADKFAGLAVADGPEGAPRLDGCLARFGCRATFEYEGGDHAIFVGEVVDMERSDAEPLIFHAGSYGQLMPPATGPGDALGEQESFGRHFVGHLLGRAYRAVNADLEREYAARGLDRSHYTALVTLGIADGREASQVASRLSQAGFADSGPVVEDLIAKGLLLRDGAHLRLAGPGQRLLSELIAVAQAAELRVEQALAGEELALLRRLLDRLAATKLD